MKLTSVASICIAVLAAQPVFADDAHKHKSHAAPAVGAGAMAMAEGEVRKVDKEAKKITLKHGPIANLDMPGMTMVFQVADPAMLDHLKAGDKVRFSADKAGSGYAITKIEPQK